MDDKTDQDKLFHSSLMDKASTGSKRRKCLADYEFITKQTSSGPSSDLGKGAFGLVKLVKDTSTQKLYAMKIVGFVHWDIKETTSGEEIPAIYVDNNRLVASTATFLDDYYSGYTSDNTALIVETISGS